MRLPVTGSLFCVLSYLILETIKVIKPFNFICANAMRSCVAMAVALSLVGCGESSSSTQGDQFGQGQPGPTPTPSPGGFNQALLLQSLTDNVILPTYTEFSDRAEAQTEAIRAYCVGLSTQASNTDELHAAAQNSWRDAAATWQMAEVMQIGPLLESSSSLRNKIYSWPNVSSCAVDQDVALAEQNGYDISSRTVSRRGLDALEYLLFNPNLDHSCTVFGTEPQGWNARTEAERKAARCEFAELVATDIVTSSQALLAAWNGDNTNPGYANILKSAGQPDSQISDVHLAVNQVSDAMFYIDTFTKDAKLATPLGLFANDCGLEPCAENVESLFAYNSIQNVIQNIRAFNLMFLGGNSNENVGFDDYLADVGDPDTAQQMVDDLIEVTQFAENLQNSLTDLLAQDPDKVEQVHSELKDVTDNLKTDFIQSLSLELPATSAGDND